MLRGPARRNILKKSITTTINIIAFQKNANRVGGIRLESPISPGRPCLCVSPHSGIPWTRQTTQCTGELGYDGLNGTRKIGPSYAKSVLYSRSDI